MSDTEEPHRSRRSPRLSRGLSGPESRADRDPPTQLPRRLPRAFYEQDAEPLAKALLGKIIVHGNRRARIVETEAYVGPHDLACHSSKGRTARTDVMFGNAGHAYIYFIYGMYDMFNIVAGGACGQAVLIRAAEPMDAWQADLAGPGKLCRAMGITRTDNRADLTSDRFHLEDDGANPRIGRTRRIGVDYAKKWKHALLRFYDKNSAAVSKHPAKTMPPRSRDRRSAGLGRDASTIFPHPPNNSS